MEDDARAISLTVGIISRPQWVGIILRVIGQDESLLGPRFWRAAGRQASPRLVDLRQPVLRAPVIVRRISRLLLARLALSACARQLTLGIIAISHN